MWTIFTWIGIALLGLILYLLPAILKRSSLEGFAGLMSNPNLHPIDPRLITDLGLGDAIASLKTKLPSVDISGSKDNSGASNMVMTPPVTGETPNVLSPGMTQTNTKQLNVNPTELTDVANLLTTIKDVAQPPDAKPSSTTSSTPAPALSAPPPPPIGAEEQGKAYYKKHNSQRLNTDNVSTYTGSSPTDSADYAPIDVPNPSQLLQCPKCPVCKPAPKCPPQKMCPDLTDYIRKDSIPCWNCKLK